MTPKRFSERLKDAFAEPETWREYLPHGYADADPARLHVAMWRIVIDAAANGRWPLLLAGHVGIGKTYAAAVCAAVWRSAGLNAVWTTWPEMRHDIAEAGRKAGGAWKRHPVTGDPFQRTANFYWHAIASPRTLVVLDDFGIGSADDQTLRIEHRVLSENCGPLVLTSNLIPEAMMEQSTIDLRVADRLNGGTIGEFTGPSLRQGKRYAVDV